MKKNSITFETRRESHEEIIPKKENRQQVILDVLADREGMTVDEIADALIMNGTIKYYDRNFVAPRLTELKEGGEVKVVGKRQSRRTGKNVAVWAIAGERA